MIKFASIDKITEDLLPVNFIKDVPWETVTKEDATSMCFLGEKSLVLELRTINELIREYDNPVCSNYAGPKYQWFE